MINSRSFALSFAKQMSGFRNSSSKKAAKGFATANKYSTISSTSLSHLTSSLNCNNVLCSPCLSVVLSFLLARYSLSLLDFVCLFLKYSQVLSRDDIKTSRLISAAVQNRAVPPGTAGRSGLGEADCDKTCSMHCSVCSLVCGWDKTHSRVSWNQARPQRS